MQGLQLQAGEAANDGGAATATKVLTETGDKCRMCINHQSMNANHAAVCTQTA